MTNEKIDELIEQIEPSKRIIARNLAEEIKFLKKTLKTLKETIKEFGVVDNSGETVKESPALKSYNTTIKSYCNCVKQFEVLLRRYSEKFEGEDALQAFLAARQ